MRRGEEYARCQSVGPCRASDNQGLDISSSTLISHEMHCTQELLDTENLCEDI